MIAKPSGDTVGGLLPSKSYATNNVASAGIDISDYQGGIGVIVDLGVKTVGDNDGAVTVKLQHSASNSAAAATDLAVGNVATTNNAAATGILIVDPRATLQFLFARVILAGTNTPTYPASAVIFGTKHRQ